MNKIDDFKEGSAFFMWGGMIILIKKADEYTFTDGFFQVTYSESEANKKLKKKIMIPVQLPK